jgi:hypothetical protein
MDMQNIQESFLSFTGTAKQKLADQIAGEKDRIKQGIKSLRITAEDFYPTLNYVKKLFARNDGYFLANYIVSKDADGKITYKHIEDVSTVDEYHTIESVMINGKPYPVPEDLRDTYNTMIFDGEGKRFTGSYLESDAIGGSSTPSPALPLMIIYRVVSQIASIPIVLVLTMLGFYWSAIAVMILKGVIVNQMLGFDAKNSGLSGALLKVVRPLKGIINSGEPKFLTILTAVITLFLWVVMAAVVYAMSFLPTFMQIIILPTFIALTMSKADKRESSRAEALAVQDSHFRRANPAVDYRLIDESHHKTRIEQAKLAIRDKSPTLDIKLRATGIFSRYGDRNAPDEGGAFIMTLRDLLPSLMVWGLPGKGKTSGLLRPFADEIFTKTDAGALVCDGKGELQEEFYKAYSNLGMKIITPSAGGSMIAPIQGLLPYKAANFIADALDSVDAEQNVWSDSARRDMTMRATILWFARFRNPKSDADPEIRWNVANIMRAIGDHAYTSKLMRAIPSEIWIEQIDAQDELFQVFNYMTSEYTKLAEETRSSITFTAQAWSTKIALNPAMLSWMQAETGVVVENVCKGDRIGIYTPFTIYGEAGAAVERICQMRLYDAILTRKGWENDPEQKYVFLFQDEMPVSWGNAKREQAVIPVARSLGLGFICAAQTLTQLEARMGEKPARDLAALFENFIAFKTDENTYKFCDEMMGHMLKIKPCGKDDVPVGIDYNGDLVAIGQSVNPNLTFIYDQEYIENFSYSAGTNQGSNSSSSLGGSSGGTSSGSSENWTSKVLPSFMELRYIKGSKITLKNDRRWNFEENAHWLETPFHVVAQLRRGGSMRRDIAIATPIFTSEIYSSMDEIKTIENEDVPKITKADIDMIKTQIKVNELVTA